MREPGLPKKVLIVCTGNTCRSPMATGILKKLADENHLSIEVQSAGLAAFAGVPATPEAVETAREMGVDLSAHQSQPLSKTLVMESDLILTMTSKHKEMILKKMPALEDKVSLLSEYAGVDHEDVGDPVGQPIVAYRKVWQQMEVYLRHVLEKLK